MESQHVKGSKAVLKCERQWFCNIFWSLWKKFSSKNSVLVVTEILTLFNNILSRKDIFCLGKSNCFTQPIQMHLSLKLKIFSQFFSAFPKPIWNFGHFETKDEPHSWCFSEMIDCKKRGYLNAWKVLCQNNYVQSTCWRVQNTAEICRAVFASYFLITLKELHFEKFCLSSIWNLETVS